jgi:hypothetical protein
MTRGTGVTAGSAVMDDGTACVGCRGRSQSRVSTGKGGTRGPPRRRGQGVRAGESSKIWQSPLPRERDREAAFACTGFSACKDLSQNETTVRGIPKLVVP